MRANNTAQAITDDNPENQLPLEHLERVTVDSLNLKILEQQKITRSAQHTR